MKVSVVICTRNRREDIVWALPSILGNDHPDYEVIVVDQSDGEETKEIVENAAKDHPNVRYIAADKRGKSFALNLGVAAAEGEIIACTDDDTETGTGWVSRAASLFAVEPELEIVFGQVHCPKDLADPEAFVPSIYFNERRELAKGVIFGMGANMAFRRSAFNRIGGYDEALGPGAPLACSEDHDFSYRAQVAGMRVVAEPSLTLVHRAHRSSRQWKRVTFLYGFGDAAFYGKHARCGDSWAMGQVARRLVGEPARAFINPVFRGRPVKDAYLQGFFTGFWKSCGVPVDRHTRLYVLPDQKK